MKNNNLVFNDFINFCTKKRKYYMDEKAINPCSKNCNLDNKDKENFKLFLENYLNNEKSLELCSSDFKNQHSNRNLIVELFAFCYRNEVKFNDENEEKFYEFLNEYKEKFNLTDNEINDIKEELTLLLRGEIFG